VVNYGFEAWFTTDFTTFDGKTIPGYARLYQETGKTGT